MPPAPSILSILYEPISCRVATHRGRAASLAREPCAATSIAERSMNFAACACAASRLKTSRRNSSLPSQDSQKRFALSPGSSSAASRSSSICFQVRAHQRAMPAPVNVRAAFSCEGSQFAVEPSLALFHSRMTVICETSSTSAVSSTLKPPKKRISTTRPSAGRAPPGL